MMTFLRSQSQTVLIVILAVIGLGFLFYGNSGNFLSTGTSPGNDFGRIDGENLQVADLYNAVRSLRGFLSLNQQDQVPQAQIAEYAWQQLLELHEADKLHIDVPDSEVIGAIQSQKDFQTNGVYDPKKFDTLMNVLQESKHISRDSFANIIRTQLRIEALQRALFSSVHALGGDARAEFEKQYGPVQISYVTFPASTFAASEKITPSEIEAAYKADSTNPAYRTEEKRQVEYVLFPLTAEQQKLPPKDKDTAIQTVGQKAIDFALALQPDPNASPSATVPPADFDTQAKKSGLTPATTGFFTATTPPPGMPPSPSFNAAAFELSKDNPVSKPIQMDNGVAVLRLKEIQPNVLRPLAEVTPAIEKLLQSQQGVLMQQIAAGSAANALQEAVKKGTDFKTAATAQHLSVQTLPAFVPRNAPMSDLKKATLGFYSARLPIGGVSEPIPFQTENSVFVLHVDSRKDADQAGLPDFDKTYREARDQTLKNNAWHDFITWLDRQPGTRHPANLDSYGGVTD